MTLNNDDVSIQVGKEIDDVVCKVLNFPWRAILSELSALEGRVLKLPLDEQGAVEIKRRIVEAKLSIVSQRRIPLNEYEVCWRQMTDLGFSSVEREASMCFYRARFLMNNSGNVNEIGDALKHLQNCTHKLRRIGMKDQANHFLSSYNRLCEEYQKRSLGQ